MKCDQLNQTTCLYGIRSKSKNSLVARFVLPFPPPTTNRVLAMNRWQRKKLRDLTDKLVSIFTPSESDSLIQMETLPSTSSTPLLEKEYFKTIGRSSSKKSATAKSKARKKE